MRDNSGDVVKSISFRVHPVGGPVRDKVDPEALRAVADTLGGGTLRGLVVLVHGYNNTFDDAKAAFSAFRDRERELAQMPINRPLADNRIFLEIYWPGDADWGIVSFLFYMGSIENAQKTADRLAPALAELAKGVPTPLEIDVVAHSMGCRLLLELIKRLVAAANVQLRHIVLMAGAVPAFMLEPAPDNHRLRQAYDVMLGGGRGLAKSLYSPADAVLAFAFPIGQTLASGDEGTFPTALGHEYWASPSTPGNLDQYEVRGAGHSDYWGWREGAKARAISMDAHQQIQPFLGFNHAPPREAASRDTFEADAPESRDITPAREVAEYKGSD